MNTKLKLAAAVIATALTGTASAGVVTDWTYDNQAGFIYWEGTEDLVNFVGDEVAESGDSSTGSSNFLPGGDYPTTLSWGVPLTNNGQSNLDIDSAVVGSITTNDWEFADGTSITHNNWVIAGDYLTNATVLDGLQLTPSSWFGAGDPTTNSPFNAPLLEFGIDFYETPNSGENGDGQCPDGGTSGYGDNINGCGDIFEVSGLDLLGLTPIFGPGWVEFSVPFNLSTGDAAWDDVDYLITTRLSGLTVLPQGYQCKGGAPCFGFVTKESTSNTLLAQFKVSTVPEPGTIALFGLALIGTAFAGRRKQS